MNSHVQYFVDRFTTSRRDVVGLWVRRSGRYLGMIFDVFRAKGLPEDLAFTAMIESGFNPVAVSRVGAKGLWQFMAPTARLYGLRVDRWVDERLDPEKSTVAAAGYLNDLYVRYGSWELAQAAYNAGEVKIDKAIRGTGSTDFWDLSRSKYLRRETKDFVPAIQAAMVIGRDPSQYGFEPSPVAMPDVERVTVPASTDLRKLATSTGIPLPTLRRLNAVLIRGVTPPGKPWDIRVPAGTRDAVVAALTPRRKVVTTASAAPSHRTAGAGIHVVRARDTVSSIAKLYGVSTGDVVRWNNLENGDAIRPGDRLRVTSRRPSVEVDGQGGFR
jgi:membrane-bound lytic murein transglycosylase D